MDVCLARILIKVSACAGIMLPRRSDDTQVHEPTQVGSTEKVLPNLQPTLVSRNTCDRLGAKPPNLSDGAGTVLMRNPVLVLVETKPTLKSG